MLTADDLSARRAFLQQMREMTELGVAAGVTPYTDPAQVEVALQSGILQMFQWAADERSHVETFVHLWNPAPGAHVLDIGCGTGRLATLVQAQRPDLSLTVLNKHLPQLQRCDHAGRVAGDMHQLPVQARCVDALILAYTLGYGAVDRVLSECARVLRPQGRLILCDVVARQSQADTMLLALGYKVYAWDRLHASSQGRGFIPRHVELLADPWLHPAFRALPAWLLDEVLAEVRPICVVWERTDD